ncbi:Crp/Fnr family transcriptional regulator [Acaryochloris sp. CCMEE 5410]|uniref:Crp/Fnr family transcriptional regulator n=1 Tax=Acaryochloris sp. CCMEE 5410 TaxID=310037 RepID=UPI0006824BE2|nr:Crp/Fnr family transcriptional regulator [Acaryochloris sp. CCMEE 5410]KAI9134461.1 Crp/Fnr family transcriptional regulator [Acaryochloris sp. CCMEE 5410]
MAVSTPVTPHSLSNNVTSLYEARSLCLRPGQVVPQQSDHLWHIESGLVRTLTWNEEGDLVTLGLWGAGDSVGRLLSEVAPFQMECLSAVEVKPLPLAGQDLGVVMRSHLRYMEELFSIISYKRAPQRLLRFLDWLGDRFGRQVDQGRILDLGLTHQLLAEITGITRVTATRLLNEFEREGKLLRLPKQQMLLQFNSGHPDRVTSMARHRARGKRNT